MMKRALFAFLVAAALAAAGPAMGQHQGHDMSSANMLMSSAPADGATLSQAPRALTLTFMHPVMLQTVAITGPNDARIPATFRRASAPTLAWSVALPQLASGAYRARWTASGGGHQMEGVVTFTVR